MPYLAFDLGAESGRVVAGTLRERRLTVEEIYRFANEPVRLPDGLHWDVLRLFHEMKKGLSLAAARYPTGLASLAVDTWGVDFGLLGEKGALLCNPYHYRDARTRGMMEEAFRIVPREDIFHLTGVQFLPINTIYQLLAWQRQQPAMLAQAQTLLMMPDLFNFFFTGARATEFTSASTTGMYDPHAGNWATGLLENLGLPVGLLPRINPPGTVVGPLLPRVAAETGAGELAVIAPGSHDTASAVATIPSAGTDHLYVSCGTWSLVGVEVRRPVITDEAEALNFTNEGAVGGGFLFLRNATGLWLVQECRRAWERRGETLDYAGLTAMARRAGPLKAVIDTDHPSLVDAEDMPEAIRACCRATGQPVPETRGEIIRCILESMALKYRWVMDKLARLLDRRFSVIHMVGGGTKNELLCQFTADATSRPVLAGPVEATAVGNLLVQAMVLGHLSDLAAARQVVRRSFDLKSYEPGQTGIWEEGYGKLVKILGS